MVGSFAEGPGDSGLALSGRQHLQVHDVRGGWNPSRPGPARSGCAREAYLPDFPEKKKGTLNTRQLMGHISGLQGYGMAMALRQDHCDDLREGIPAMQEDTLLWVPGERYRYSNYGFRMVGAIVRAAADEPYIRFMQREVFDPMGMDHTVLDTAMYSNPDDLATPYNKRSFGTLRRS